jgi:hypothetical protein
MRNRIVDNKKISAVSEFAIVGCGIIFLVGSWLTLISSPQSVGSRVSCNMVIRGDDGRIYPIRFTPNSKESFEHIVGPGRDVLSIYCF